MEGFHIDKIADEVQAAMKDLSSQLEDLGLTGQKWGPEGESEGEAGPGELNEQQFEVGPNPVLSVSNVSGRIAIRTEEGSVIRVRGIKHGSSRARANTRMDYSSEGNRVTIQTRGDPSGLLGFSRQVSRVDYDIVVPPGCEVQAKSVSADVTIEGTRARVTAETVSGDLAVSDAAGECRVTTVSGDVTARRIEGLLILRSTSGDARVTESRLSHFNLNSVSGDFSLETPLTHGQHYLAKTVSGDLEVLVPPTTGATISMKSVSGDVTSELPAEIIKSGRRHWQGRINGGGANLEMSSVSGDLRFARSSGSPYPSSAPAPTPELRTTPSPSPTPDLQNRPSEPGAPTAPVSGAAPPPPPTPEATDATSAETETAAILKALEQGEISVEEAMERLDALR